MKKIFYLFFCFLQESITLGSHQVMKAENHHLSYLKHKAIDILVFVSALLVSHKIIKRSEHPVFDKYERIAKHVRHEISEELYNIHVHHKPLEIFIITLVLSSIIIGMHYGIHNYIAKEHAYVWHSLIHTFLMVLTLVVLVRHNIRFEIEDEYHSH